MPILGPTGWDVSDVPVTKVAREVQLPGSGIAILNAVTAETGVLYRCSASGSGYVAGEWYRWDPVAGAIEAVDAAGGGGGGTWGSITGTLSAQTDLQNTLNAKAPMASPSFTGLITSVGAQVITASPMAALEIDTTKALNPKTVSANSTLTFSGTPAQANTYFGLALTNSSGSDITITIPSSYSLAQGAAITSFIVPGNAIVELLWRYDGSQYLLAGEPVRIPVSVTWSFIGTSTARDYPLVLKCGVAFRITNVVSKCASGTATATVKIDTAALGGTANSVSSTEQDQVHASANTVAVGADVVVTFTAGAVDPQLTLIGYRL